MRLLDRIIIFFGTCLLKLRYKIVIKGMDKILEKGNKGILFLPNHIALLDPAFIVVVLYKKFQPHAIADFNNVNIPIIRDIARRLGTKTIPDMTISGLEAQNEIKAVLNESIEDLKNGKNILLYPAGRIKKQYKEIIGATSGVEDILKKVPGVRVVLVRQNGLWGSIFSWSYGTRPSVVNGLVKGLKILLGNLIFFAPRRELRFEFVEPEDFPYNSDKMTINHYLENFYNADNQPNTYVPFYFWKREKIKVVPEPETVKLASDISTVPESTKIEILKYLEEKTGIHNITETQKLAGDLGMDSIAISEMAVWLEQEFGCPPADTDAYNTVADAIASTTGQIIANNVQVFRPVDPRWFASWKTMNQRLKDATAPDIAKAVLHQAKLYPDRIIMGDQVSGEKTYRDIILMILALRPLLEKIPEDTIGIMMPGGVMTNILFLAVMFTGKIPVMVNWTTGVKNIRYCLNNVGTKTVLTSKKLLEKLHNQGLDFSGLNDFFVLLEDESKKITKSTKIKALLASRFCWRSLYKAKINEIAVILFTSGSENTPKSVPLTHKNLLANANILHHLVYVEEKDVMLGILPSFHSFGLTVTVVLPLILGARAVYHANPTESIAIAHIIEEYKATLMLSTPTFVNALVRVMTKKQMETIRVIITGAEKCSDALYEKMKNLAPHATIMEGYGATECSPVISLNDEKHIVRGSLGHILPNIEYAIIDVDTNKRVEINQIGRLIVSGDSIFNGYINYNGNSPFIEFEGKSWYNTGDLVRIDENGILWFAGRLKRFIKIAGEMISLPAIEDALIPHCGNPEDEKPQIAVTNTKSEENPEIILFTIVDLDRAFVNQCIRNAGLSGLHNIRTIKKIDEIPLLGTGKVDYRTLQNML